jgi:hypothetical protein
MQPIFSTAVLNLLLSLSMKPLTKDKNKIRDEVRNKCVIDIYTVNRIHLQHLASNKSEKKMTEKLCWTDKRKLHNKWCVSGNTQQRKTRRNLIKRWAQKWTGQAAGAITHAMILSHIAKFVCSKINSEIEAHLFAHL